jgi:hypothetical protein
MSVIWWIVRCVKGFCVRDGYHCTKLCTRIWRISCSIRVCIVTDLCSLCDFWCCICCLRVSNMYLNKFTVITVHLFKVKNSSTEVKVKSLELNWASDHANVWGTRGIAPCSLTLAVAGGEWLAFYSSCFIHDKEPWSALDRKLGWPHSRPGHLGGKKDPVLLGLAARCQSLYWLSCPSSLSMAVWLYKNRKVSHWNEKQYLTYYYVECTSFRNHFCVFLINIVLHKLCYFGHEFIVP